MPRIKAFKGIRPAANETLQVVAKPFDQFFTPEARAILENNPKSFLHTIEPLIENAFLRGSREMIVFKKAKEHFDEFKEEGILLPDAKESIYVYRTFNKGRWQTGIWCITAIDDYLDNTLRKHEHTRAEREKDLISYLDNTGIDANPVLVTYAATASINEVLSACTSTEPLVDFELDDQRHQLWRIDDSATLQLLTKEFASLPASYIADGHHRAAAASLAGIQRRKNNLRHRGNEDYNFFSTLYFDFSELMVFEFQRVISDLNGLSSEAFVEKLRTIFDVHTCDFGKPDSAQQFRLYINQTWYQLSVPAGILAGRSAVEKLDVSLLQELVLAPILDITDPRRDKRIKFVGGLKSVEEIVAEVDSGEMQCAFFLYPTSIEELIAVADSGEVMPPKSTWFEPKLHCGLVVHEVR